MGYLLIGFVCVLADVENRYYDAHRRIAQFLLGDLVWVRTHPQSKASEKCSSKLAPKWSEPAQVMKILGPLNYRLEWQDTDNTDTVHVGNLKSYFRLPTKTYGV